MDEQLDVVVVSKVTRDLREWLRYKAYIEERTMSSIIRDMLEAAREAEPLEPIAEAQNEICAPKNAIPPYVGRDGNTDAAQ